MKILYMGNHPDSEFYELSFFLEAGHQVFSIGEQLFPETVPAKREIKGMPKDADLTEKFWELHPNYAPGKLIQVNRAFLQEFDLIVMSDYQEHLALNFKEIFKCKKQAVWVWRKRPRATLKHYRTVQNLKGKGLRTLELPYGGRYKVSECNDLWIDFLKIVEAAI